MTNVREGALVVTPLTKEDKNHFTNDCPERDGERNEPNYRNPVVLRMVLGSMLHSIIGRFLSKTKDKPIAANLIKFLDVNNELGSELMTFFAEKVPQLVAQQIEQATSLPYEKVTWVSEVSFTMKRLPFQILSFLNQDRSLIAAVQQTNPETDNLYQLAKGVLLNKDFSVAFADTNYRAADLISLARQALTEFDVINQVGKTNDELAGEVKAIYDQLGDQDKLALFYLLILAYYNFDFSGVGLEFGLEKFVAMASARADLMGFYVVGERQGLAFDHNLKLLIERAKIYLAGNLFDFINFSAEQIEDLHLLVSEILAGRIGFVLGEVKTQTFSHDKKGGSPWQKVVFSKELSDEHMADLAHTAFSLFQFLSRFLEVRARHQQDLIEDNNVQVQQPLGELPVNPSLLPRTFRLQGEARPGFWLSDKPRENGFMTTDVSDMGDWLHDLMNPNYSQRRLALRQIIRALSNLSGKYGLNHLLVIKVFAPVVNPRQIDNNQLGIQRANFNGENLEVEAIRVNWARLNRAVMQTARNFARRLADHS